MLTIRDIGFAVSTLLCSCAAFAADTTGVVAAGAKQIEGKIIEWPVPTPQFPRDATVATDGGIYFAVKSGDKIARFDPKSERFREWKLPQGTAPNGMAAIGNKVYFGSHDKGYIGELDLIRGTVREFHTSSPSSTPYSMTVDGAGSVWFTERKTGKVGRLDPASGKIKEYAVGGDPYDLEVGRNGIVWISLLKTDKFVRLDPRTGKTAEIGTGPGSAPRRVAVAPDGTVWMTLYGVGAVAKIDPAHFQVAKTYNLPGGSNSGPYAINADAMGRIWVSEIQTDNIVVLDPRTDAMRVFKLPTKDASVRNATIDAQGRYWYVGSHAGILGVIE